MNTRTERPKRSRLLFVGLLASAFLLPGTAAAKMYKWTDAEGNVHYTQTPPPEGAKQGKQMDVRTGSVVKVRKRGKNHFCGSRRLPKVSPRPAIAIANLNSSLLGWDDSIVRVREQREEYIKSNAKRATTSRFNKRLRNFDKQVAEYECQTKWGKEKLASLEGDKGKILEHHKKLETLQAQVEARKESTCGVDNRAGVIVVDNAYREYQKCIRPFDRELRKIRKTIRKSKSDVKLVSD